MPEMSTSFQHSTNITELFTSTVAHWVMLMLITPVQDIYCKDAYVRKVLNLASFTTDQLDSNLYHLKYVI